MILGSQIRVWYSPRFRLAGALPDRKSIVSCSARAATEWTQEKQRKQEVDPGSTLGSSGTFPIALRASNLATSHGAARTADPRLSPALRVYILLELVRSEL